MKNIRLTKLKPIELKRNIIIIPVALTLLVSSLFLLSILFDELNKIGLIGYVFFWLFLFALFWINHFERERINNIKTIKKMAEEIEEECKNKYQDMTNAEYLSLENYKEEFSAKLINKLENEKIIIDRTAIENLILVASVVTVVELLLFIFFSRHQ